MTTTTELLSGMALETESEMDSVNGTVLVGVVSGFEDVVTDGMGVVTDGMGVVTDCVGMVSD